MVRVKYPPKVLREIHLILIQGETFKAQKRLVSSTFWQNKKPPIDKNLLSIDGILFGGGEESRTPVRKPIHANFYECSLSFKIPSLNRR